MKFTLFTLTVAGLAAAQNLKGLAPCVQSCIQKAIPEVGCSGTPDEVVACLCKPESQSKLLAPVTQCATENKCNTDDLLKAQQYSAESCKAIASGAPKNSAHPTSLAPTATPTFSSNGTMSGVAGSTGLGTATGTGSQPHATNGAAAMGPAAGALVAIFAAVLAL
ncbi:hypothetical protein E4U55_000732 [Claviceps digitariae]|nr:hypothetical protein E4U55_000732 [Claviceps digitariae]